MLPCIRIIAELRAAASAAPLPLAPRVPRGRQWHAWEIREMVWLRHRGYLVREIAARLRKSEAAVEKQLYRARHGLIKRSY